MSLLDNIKALGIALTDLVFPISCVICGKEGAYLCENCLGKLPHEEKQRCIICKESSPFGKTHNHCVSKNIVDGLITALPYQHPDVKKTIGVFKYNFVSDLAPILSSLLYEEIKRQNLLDYFKDFVIVPIPLHRKRLNWRGFNQAQLIVEELVKKLGLSFNLDLVVRSKFTKPQVDLNLEERKKNILNAFTLTAPRIQGKYLLVDDVVTSGSTLNEIAKILKRAGAVEVWAATVARD